VTFVESDVSLFRSPDEASGFFVVVRAIYEAPAVARDFAKAFSSGAGAKPSAVEIESRKSLGAGDEAIAVTVAFSVGGVRFRAAFVHVRVKRVVGTLIATGRAQTFHSADLEPLATRLARRIDDVL
jgi:hypothetical protein